MNQLSLDVLWTQVWQVSILVLIVAALNTFLRRKSPHLATLLWLVVLFKCLTPPLVSSPSSLFSWIQPAVVARAEPTVELIDLKRKTDATNSYRVDYEDAKHSGLTPIASNRLLPAESLQPVVASDRGSSNRKPVGRSDDSDQTKGFVLTNALGICWLTGFTIVLSWTLLRYALFRRSIGKTLRYDRELNQMARRLCRKLRVRRQVSVWITTSHIGPAVIGLFRPVIVLPDVVVASKAPAEIEPILAHEINHLRRGDTWYGAVQIVVLCCWWFHPLIWLINRMITRDIERCCDESTIARLNYSPVEYARCLLDVVQLKQLKPVPSSPGVRRIDITRKRLEKIMKLRQGSRNKARSRASLICWLVAVSLAAATIPGAAFVTAQDSGRTTADQVDPKTYPNPVKDANKKRDEKFVERTYDVEKALHAFDQQFEFNDLQSAKPAFKNFLRSTACPLRREKITFKGINGKPITQTREERSRILWDGNRLVITETEVRHQAIGRVIKIAEQGKFDQFIFDVLIISTDQKTAEKLGLFSSEGTVEEPVKSVPPAAVKIIKDQLAIEKIADVLATSNSVDLLSTPRVTTWFESKCYVSVGGQKSVPLVKDGMAVGFDYRFIGTRIDLQVRSSKNDDDIIVQFGVKNIGVAKEPIQHATYAEGDREIKLPVPCFTVRQLSSGAQIRPGNVIVAGIESAVPSKKGERTIAILSVSRLGKGQKPDPHSTKFIDQIRSSCQPKPVATKKLDSSKLVTRSYRIADVIDGYNKIAKASKYFDTGDKSVETMLADELQYSVGKKNWPAETKVLFDYRSGSFVVKQTPENHEKIRQWLMHQRFYCSHKTHWSIQTHQLKKGSDLPDELFGKALTKSEVFFWEQWLKGQSGVKRNILAPNDMTIPTFALMGIEARFNAADKDASKSFCLKVREIDTTKDEQDGDLRVNEEPINSFATVLELTSDDGKSMEFSVAIRPQTNVLLDVSKFVSGLGQGERAIMRIQFDIRFDHKIFQEYKQLYEKTTAEKLKSKSYSGVNGRYEEAMDLYQAGKGPKPLAVDRHGNPIFAAPVEKVSSKPANDKTTRPARKRRR